MQLAPGLKQVMQISEKILQFLNVRKTFMYLHVISVGFTKT